MSGLGRYSKNRTVTPFTILTLLVFTGSGFAAVYFLRDTDQARLDKINEELLTVSAAPNPVPVNDWSGEQRLRRYNLLVKREEILNRHPDWPPIGLHPSARVRALAGQIREQQRERGRKRLSEQKKDGEELIWRIDDQIQEENDKFKRESQSLTLDDVEWKHLKRSTEERIRELREERKKEIRELNERLEGSATAVEGDANHLFDPNYRKQWGSEAEDFKRFMKPSDFYLK